MTALLYLENAYLKEMEATIIEVAKESDGQQRWLLILDKTIFYPRGAVRQLIRDFFLRIPGKGK